MKVRKLKVGKLKVESRMLEDEKLKVGWGGPGATGLCGGLVGIGPVTILIARNFRLSLMMLIMGVFALIFIPSGCTKKSGTLPISSGKTLELVVVVDRPEGGKKLPEAMAEVFQSPQPCLNQSEPRFDLLVIPDINFTKLFNTHHNLFLLKIFPDAEKEGITISRNVWAQPQVVIALTARNDSSANTLIRSNASALLKACYESETKKLALLFARKTPAAIAEGLLQKQGIALDLPECFYIAASGSDYFWLRCRDEEKETGLLTALFPFTDTAAFAAPALIQLCDSLVSAIIPGSRPGSYMTICREVPPQAQQSDINNQFAMELRGLWETQNDQMGGPFLAYLMPDPSRKHLLVQFAYVYHPNQPKRDLLMQMETIMRSVSFLSPESLVPSREGGGNVGG